jgi:transketolase
MATGGILGVTMAAADQLAADGVSCRIISMHTVRPLDVEAIAAASNETGGIITIEEHTSAGGLGGAVAEYCLEAGVVPKRFGRAALRAGYSSIVGSQSYLRSRYGLDETAIVELVRKTLA